MAWRSFDFKCTVCESIFDDTIKVSDDANEWKPEELVTECKICGQKAERTLNSFGGFRINTTYGAGPGKGASRPSKGRKS